MDKLEECADFLSSLANFFLLSHGQRIKVAYIDIFNKLLLPVAKNVTAEANYPSWTKTVDLLYPKAASMMLKQRYWNSAFQLGATLLFVSPQDYFARHWRNFLETAIPKYKEKSQRYIAVANVVRLVWVYLFRWSEPAVNATRKLDTITRSFFVPGKKNLASADVPLELLAQYVRFVSAKHSDYCFKNILLPLLNADVVNQYKGLIPLEHLQPERMNIALNAYMYIIYDRVSNQTIPPFPETFKDNFSLPSDASQLISKWTPPNNSTFQENHKQFLQLFGKIAYSCDYYSGREALQDERVSQPKTPLQATFQFASENSMPALLSPKDRLLHFDLLRAVYDCLAICVPPNLPMSKLVDMFCLGLTHPDVTVARSSVTSLRALTGHHYLSQQCVVGFARFLFRSDKTAGSLVNEVGNSHQYESTLALYVELLQIWIKCLKARSEAVNGQPPSNISTTLSDMRGTEMEITSTWTVIEEIESNGLFFLCHHSQPIRHLAIQLLRLIARFDSVLDEQGPDASIRDGHQRTSSRSLKGPRIIDLVEDPETFASIKFDMEQMSVAERSRLQKLQSGSRSGKVMLKLIDSDISIDASIWFKAFPQFIKICFEKFPITVVLCRDTICARLLDMQRSIHSAAEFPKATSDSNTSLEIMARQSTSTHQGPETLINQWGLYLIVACSTLTLTDGQSPKYHYVQHGRKRSVPVATFDRITSARTLFQMIIPLLSVENSAVRGAIVNALGCININLYKPLIEILQPTMKILGEEARARIQAKSYQQTRHTKRNDMYRAEICHTLHLTSQFLKDPTILKDEWIFETIINFIKETKLFLSDSYIQEQWEAHLLRRYFCGLVESMYDAIMETSNPSRWLPLEGRVSLFRLIEEWCGFGPHSMLAKNREKRMRILIMDQVKDLRDRGALTAGLEIERKKLEITSLCAMASLCVSICESSAR